jgi:histidinol-phosphate aminotransferase
MQRNAERIKVTRAELTAELRKRGFEVPDSHTNFVLARLPGEDLGPLQQDLKQRGVLVRHFKSPDLVDALRVTVGTAEEIARFLTALDEARKGR